MAITIAFLLKSIFVSSLLLLNYYIALRNKQLHQYNRFYLLLSLVLPVVLPFLNINLYSFRQYIPAGLSNLSTEIFAGYAILPQSLLPLEYIVFTIIIVICLIMLLILLSRVVWIYKAKNSHPIKRMDGYNVIETDLKQAPFCFLNNLFWRRSLSMCDENGEKIFVHELTHIQQRHTYDKLFAQIMLCFFWINPFFWLIQRELNQIHEFIADSKSIKDGDTESFARMLLQSHNEGLYLNPSHSFFHSSIKRRLIMITTSKNTQYSHLRRVLVLPIILVAMIVFACTKTSSETNLASTKMVANKETAITTIASVQFKNEDGNIDSKITPITYSVAELNNVREKISSNHSTITTNVTFTKEDGTIGNINTPIAYAVVVSQSSE